MFSGKNPDVLVVGAGPVGLFTALTLSDRGLRVQIVDRAPHAGTRSYALALHAEELRLLEEANLLPDVLEQSLRIRKVGLYDRERRRAELRISDLAEDHSFLAVLPQSLLERTLERALARRGVKVQWSHAAADLELVDRGVDVAIDRMALDTLGYSVQHSEWVVAKTTRHCYPFVVGADGNSSVVRRRLDIDFPSVGARSEFAVFEFRTDADLGDEMRLILDEQTTNVCWPLPDGRCRWSFQRPLDHPDHDSREKDVSLVQVADRQFPELTEDYLRALLAERAPWFEGRIQGIQWRMEVRFESRLAERFGRGRAWLVGDAGH
ncbi:MAG: FAD-dependent monooxygenase, partial [Planctomycetes bacterium]|nr:FAD-dependent monooxygenase [Planctomycetota bacterium]